MKILVTGANGFMGTNFVRYIKEKNPDWNITAFILKGTTVENIRKYCSEIIEGDIKNEISVKGICKGMDSVVHFAAYVSDWGNPALFYIINTIGTDNLLMDAVRHKVKKFIHISSLSIFGFKEHVNGNEDLPYVFSNVDYVNSKIYIEGKIKFYSENFPLETIIIYPGYMPFGEEDVLTTGSFFKMTEKGFLLKTNRADKKICTSYVKNLVYGIYLAITKEGIKFDKFIITDGDDISWSEIIDTYYHVLGKKSPDIRVPFSILDKAAKSGELIFRALNIRKSPPLTNYRINVLGTNLCFSCDKAKRVLGYNPVYSFREGMENSKNWYLGVKEKL